MINERLTLNKELMASTDKLTDYKCPICNNSMRSFQGDFHFSSDAGFTVYCPSTNHCPCYENVQGWGRNEKAAYEIAITKYGR